MADALPRLRLVTNKGDWTFEAELIGKLGGTYAASPSDVDAMGI